MRTAHRAQFLGEGDIKNENKRNYYITIYIIYIYYIYSKYYFVQYDGAHEKTVHCALCASEKPKICCVLFCVLFLPNNLEAQ